MILRLFYKVNSPFLYLLFVFVSFGGFAKTTNPSLCDVNREQVWLAARTFDGLGNFLNATEAVLERHISQFYKDGSKCADLRVNKLLEGDFLYRSYIMSLIDFNEKIALMSSYGIYKKLLSIDGLNKNERESLLSSYYNSVVDFDSLNFKKWERHVDKDEMRGILTYRSYLTSENSQEIGEPYGKVYAMIVAYQTENKNKTSEPHVMLAVTGGQLHYRATEIHVKFDDREVMGFSGNICNDNNTLFCLKDYEDMLFRSYLLESKKAIVEVYFYGGEARQFKFDAEGLSFRRENREAR